MRALLIDPVEQTVTEVQCNPDNLQEIYKLIHADCFDMATIRRSSIWQETIFVDDMGLLKDTNYFFKVSGYPQYLAGYGLLMGCDARGYTRDTKLQPEDLGIQWLGQLERVK